MSELGTKICSKCKEEKSLDDFQGYFNKKRQKTMLDSRCKDCRSDYRRDYYQGNRQREIENAEKWAKNNKKKANANKAKWNKKNGEFHIQHKRKLRADLDPSYVRALMNIKKGDCKDEKLIELKCSQVKLHRAIKRKEKDEKQRAREN